MTFWGRVPLSSLKSSDGCWHSCHVHRLLANCSIGAACHSWMLGKLLFHIQSLPLSLMNEDIEPLATVPGSISICPLMNLSTSETLICLWSVREQLRFCLFFYRIITLRNKKVLSGNKTFAELISRQYSNQFSDTVHMQGLPCKQL